MLEQGFVTWVDSILSNHKGCKLDEFKLVYYLDNSHQLIIDKWLVWAFSKHVQRLILDFTPPCVTYACHLPEDHFYPLSHRTLVSVTTPYLTTLCLTSVNVDAPTLHYLLHACASTLEDLSIVSSQCLTSIAALELPSLKSFIVVDCPRLEIIDIQAPKLVSLTYNAAWYAVLRVFNVSNSSLLSYADISAKDEQHFLFIFRSLFKCFPHLEHLKLNWIANLDMDLVLGNFPVLANLKHLEMFPKKASVRTFAAWVPFIGACPRLEKLTLGIGNWLLARAPKNMYRENCPLRYLKTFEIRSFHGRNLDVDIANFVVQNGISLQEVIVHLSCYSNQSLNLEAPFADLDFELPSHVKLVIVK